MSLNNNCLGTTSGCKEHSFRIFPATRTDPWSR